MLTLEQIKELMEIVGERRIPRFELERAGFRLRIDGVAPTPVVTTSTLPGPGPVLGSSAGGPQPPAEAAAPPTGDADAAGHHVIKSPIVGTFYSAPSPDAEPFVSVGDRVSKGQVICIVEAMKLMNEIEADEDGVVAEILGRNGEPVEFGEALFRIEAD